MIPLTDENPSKTFPIVTIILILVNLSVFAYQTNYFTGTPNEIILRLGFIPYEFFHFEDIAPANWLPPQMTIISAMFMHGGWLHLLGNMLYLWIFGDNVEDVLGHTRYLFFYLICGLWATLAHGLMNIESQIPTVGASGAIAGLLGAYMISFPGARIKTLIFLFVFIKIVPIPAFLILGYWILIQILSGLSELERSTQGGVAWFAHIGGFAAGIIFIFLMKKRSPRRK
jgi:membrane associated rhomboid family serine protease